jgi:hypothetical protein
MADNTEDLTRALEDIARSLQENKLSQRTSEKADKAILEELRRKRKFDQSDSRTKRVVKRTASGAWGGVKGAAGAVGKAAGGFVGREIGGIPIAGAIFRILGKKFANASLERKQYKKTLIIRRKLELKEMARMEKIRAKLDARRDDAAAKADAARKLEDAQKDAGDAPEKTKGGKGGMAAAVEKMADAAMHMQATVISMTPAIQTFHETVEKMSEVVDAMHDNKNNDPGKVRDAQLLEYLHGIEYLTQESAAIAENGQEVLKTMGKDIGTIKWHTARQNGTVGRIEKLIKDREDNSIDGKTLETISKDVGTIKWHTARQNGSVGRMEKLLVTAAADRIAELKNQDTQIKLQKKALGAQEEQTGIAVLNLAANVAGTAMSAIGSVGSAIGGAVAGVGGAVAATAVGGAVIAALPEILAAGVVVAAIGGLAYAVYKMLPNSWTGGSTANGVTPEDNLKRANDLATANGKSGNEEYQTPEQQAYAKQNGRYADKSMYMSSDPAKPGTFKASAEMYPWEHDRLMQQQEQDHGIGTNSAAVEEARKNNVQGAATQTNVNNTNVSNSTTNEAGGASPVYSGTIQRTTN